MKTNPYSTIFLFLFAFGLVLFPLVSKAETLALSEDVLNKLSQAFWSLSSVISATAVKAQNEDARLNQRAMEISNLTREASILGNYPMDLRGQKIAGMLQSLSVISSDIREIHSVRTQRSLIIRNISSILGNVASLLRESGQ